MIVFAGTQNVVIDDLDRSKIVMQSISNKEINNGKILARLAIIKISEDRIVKGKLGLKGKTAKQKIEFLIKIFIEQSNQHSIELNNNVLAIALYYCVNPEKKLPKIGGAVAGLADLSQNDQVTISGLQINLYSVKQSLTRFLLTHIINPKLKNAADFEDKLFLTKTFITDTGFEHGFKSTSARSLVHIAYPESLEFGKNFNPVIRPWLLEHDRTDTKEIAKAIAWILLHKEKVIKDHRIDVDKIKKVAWTKVFQECKINGYINRKFRTNQKAIEAGILVLIEEKIIHSNSKNSPVAINTFVARDWKSINSDGSILIDEVTIFLMNSAKLQYPELFQEGKIIPTNIPNISWATLYSQQDGTCLANSGLKPAQAIARVYGHEVFGWNPGQILPEYFISKNDLQDSKTKLKIKLAHGLHQTGLGTYRDGIYSFTENEYEKWKASGSFNSTLENFIIKSRITKNVRDFSCNFSRALFWFLTSEENIPDHIPKIAGRADIDQIFKTGLLYNNGVFSIKFEDTLSDLLPYNVKSKDVVDLINLQKVNSLSDLYKKLRDDALKTGKISKTYKGRIVIDNFLLDNLLNRGKITN